MKIYLAASLTICPDEYRKQMEEFREKLKTSHEVLDWLGLEKGTPKDVYEHDTDAIARADLVIADCTYPSTGLGYEIAHALAFNKRVIAGAKEGSTVSRLIQGIQNDNFKFVWYKDLNELLNYI